MAIRNSQRTCSMRQIDFISGSHAQIYILTRIKMLTCSCTASLGIYFVMLHGKHGCSLIWQESILPSWKQQKGWTSHQLDVNSSFLNNTEILLCQFSESKLEKKTRVSKLSK